MHSNSNSCPNPAPHPPPPHFSFLGSWHSFLVVVIFVLSIFFAGYWSQHASSAWKSVEKKSGDFFSSFTNRLICTTRGSCSQNKRHFRSNFSLNSYTHNLTSSLVPVTGYPVRTLSDLRPGKRHFAREPLSLPALCGRAKPLPCVILWDVLPGGPTTGRPLYNHRASAPWTACCSAASTRL